MAKRPLQTEANVERLPSELKRRKKKNSLKVTPGTVIGQNSKSRRNVPGMDDGNDKRASDSRYLPTPELSALPQSTIDEYLSSNSIHIADPSTDPSLRPITSFSFLPESSNDLYLPLEKFSSPTPIQAVSWPLAFAGRDLIGVAETGSGKTLAFGLPCLRRVLELNNSETSCKPCALIITPTRELAVQIYDQLLRFSSAVDVGIACIYGGSPKDHQRREIRNASVVIATPGRLKDFQADQTINLSGVKYLVLDEADRMLDKGFEQDIQDIVKGIPSTQKRQTIMFTATWPIGVRNLAASFTKNPVTVTIGDSSDIRANKRIKQMVEVLQPYEKDSRLLELLRRYQDGGKNNHRILVFCLYKKEAMRVERFIGSKGFKVAGIHGDMSQTERFRSLEAFKSGSISLLVATDVAARGLDIPAVKLVLNVTFPLTIEDYVHRIGRTGRAGAEGLAITLFTERDKALSGPLINVLRAADQDVPESLLKFGATVKKKQHESYGAFFREMDTTKVASRIKFED
ncbi:ATP-dependent RNA helicase DBP3 [Coccidioides immitis RS]|uniref:ATP-dependent RNA helicase DBP3 n=2 Tax=Coccidioides immitis TaxID=5501 RepID=DBP3_COCIM|nr:ATP-dependent RNA helicase DBP3 [Coccidioides immitis RS]Q1DZK8.2 RecName: Full=ATP-dependent RNA helicase DBP3 [Coccidioides immitis RS]EAS33231.3 ATP-dependent RNA helicase DBP3 [Coccidioides immitis RS]